jgi:hypothetical protein
MPSNRANPFEIGSRARIVFAGPFPLWAGNENRHSGAGRNPGNDAESGGANSGPRPAPGRQMPSIRANPFEICRRARIVFAGPFTLWAGNETVIPAQAGIQEMMPNLGANSGPRPAPG